MAIPPVHPELVASLDELRAARLSGKRLLALWNGLPDAERLTKIGNRAVLVDRLWSALQALPDPQPARASKQAEVIALLRRPEGATVDEVRAATGWQPHTVRGVAAEAQRWPKLCHNLGNFGLRCEKPGYDGGIPARFWRGSTADPDASDP